MQLTDKEAALLTELTRSHTRIDHLEGRIGDLEGTVVALGKQLQAPRPGPDKDMERRLTQELRDVRRAGQLRHQQMQESHQQMQDIVKGIRQDKAEDHTDKLKGMQQQLQRLTRTAKATNLIVTTASGLPPSQLLRALNTSLAASSPATQHLLPDALQPIRSSDSSRSLWLMQSGGMHAKHALFHDSKRLRQQKIYLDDDLTEEQPQGRHSLRARRLELKAKGCRTWWRQHTLCWSDAACQHRETPVAQRH